MIEKKRKRIVYAIFVLAVVWGIFNIPSAKKHTAYSYDDNYSEDESDQSAVQLQADNSGSPEFKYTGDWGNDPFVRKAPAKESRPRETYNLNLSAVSESNGEFWALVNGKVMAVGDEIDGWKIIKITKKSAVLGRNGKTIELTIKGA